MCTKHYPSMLHPSKIFESLLPSVCIFIFSVFFLIQNTLPFLLHPFPSWFGKDRKDMGKTDEQGTQRNTSWRHIYSLENLYFSSSVQFTIVSQIHVERRKEKKPDTDKVVLYFYTHPRIRVRIPNQTKLNFFLYLNFRRWRICHRTKKNKKETTPPMSFQIL